MREERHRRAPFATDSARRMHLENQERYPVGIPAEKVLTEVDAAPATEISRPVDLTHLARQTFGQRELEQEVLRLFLRHTSIHLARLKASADPAGRRAAAHFIKGSARGIGAWQVATAADIVERAPDREGEAIETLSAAIAEANAFISTLLDE